MKSCPSLVAALLISVFAIGSAEAGFKALNNYLVDKVSSRDINANLQAAGEYLEKLEAAKPSIFSIKTSVDEVRLFLSLQQVVDDTQCDSEALQIMTDNQARAGDSKDRRVDLVMQEIFNQHAEKCSVVYPTKFQELKSQFGKAAYDKVANIGEQVMKGDQEVAEESNSDMIVHFYDLDNIFERYVARRFSIAHQRGPHLRMAIKSNANGSDNVIYSNKILDERTDKSTVNRDKFIELVKEHLVKPCTDYLAKFGRDLFVPARYDAQWQTTERVEANSEFYSGWAYYSICRSLVDNQSKVLNDIFDSS